MPTILLNNIRPGGNYLKNLKINSTEIKYVKRGDGKLFYDTLKDTTYSDITITSFLYATGIVPASGGSTSAPSYAYSQKITPVGYASNYSSSTVTSGASISFSKVSGDGATVNSTTGVVTFSSRGTTYSASLRSAVVKITVSLNGKTSTKEVTCYLSANLITAVTANSNVFSYDNISASATSATPSTSHTPIFTFSSTSTSTTIPNSTYGSLTATCSYRIANTTTNGFTACNSSTGVLTATARGTTIGNERKSATVTKTLKYTWTPVSGYGSAVNSGNLTKTATCTQNGNYVTAVTCTANTLSYAAIGAGATASGTPTYNFGNAKFTYTSGSSAEGAPSSTYGTYSSSVKFTIANTTTNGFTAINASTGVLTSTSRGTTIGNARSSATVTCTLTMTWTPTASYNAEGTKSGTKTATATCTLNGNYVTAVTNQIDTFSYGSAVAKGGDVSPNISRSCTLTFSSGSSKAGCTTSAGYTGGTITNTISYSGSATGATVNTSSGTVTWANRTTTIGNSRSVEVTATSSYTFTHDSSYNSGKAITGTAKTLKATCSQNANYVTAVGVNSNSLSYSNIGAGDTSASPTSSHTPIFTFSSTSTSTTTPGSSYGTLTATVKYTLAASKNGFTAVNATSGVLTATARGTTIGNARTSDIVTKSITYSWAHSSTYSGGGTKTSSASTKTATCTQDGNYVTAVTPKASEGYSTHSSYASTISAAGGTVSPTNHGRATYTFSSGKTVTDGSTSWTTAGTTTYTRTYSATLATGFTSVTSAGAVTASGRGTTSGNARSQTVSAKLTVKFVHSSTYSAGGTVEGSVTHSLTCTLNHNNPSTVYNTPTINSVTSKDIPAKGGTFDKSWLTVTYSQTGYYNYPSGSNTSSSPHSVASSATATQAMISFTGTAPTGSNLGSTPHSRTSKGSVTVTVTANGKTSSGKSVTVYQQANSYSDALNAISGTASYSTWAYNSTTAATPTKTCTASYTRTWTSTSTLTVTSSVTPSITSTSVTDTTNWLVSTSTTGSIKPKASNPNYAQRSTKVTLTYSYGGKTCTVTCYAYLAAKPSYRIRVTNNTLYDANFTFGSSSACSYNETYANLIEMYLCTADNFCDVSNNNTSMTIINNGGSTSSISSNYWSLYVIQEVYRSGGWRWNTCGSFEWVAQTNIDVPIQPTYSDM